MSETRPKAYSDWPTTRVEAARAATHWCHTRGEAAVLEVRRRAVAVGVADAAGEGGGLGGEARVDGAVAHVQLQEEEGEVRDG